MKMDVPNVIFVTKFANLKFLMKISKGMPPMVGPDGAPDPNNPNNDTQLMTESKILRFRREKQYSKRDLASKSSI